MAASKPTDRQTDRHTHARAQCSLASVGLAQARPNHVENFFKINIGPKEPKNVISVAVIHLVPGGCPPPFVMV